MKREIEIGTRLEIVSGASRSKAENTYELITRDREDTTTSEFC